MKNRSSLSDTDLCVMCGMCLPHCPTYQLYQTETESPRGRITLIQSIDRKQISPNKKAIRHIDHCLGCLNCQTICPSQVPFGQIIDEFRTRFSSSIPKPLISRYILKQSTKINGLERFKFILSLPLLGKSLQSLIPLTGAPIPRQESQPLLNHYKTAATPSQGSISLFTGCIGKLTDSQTLIDTSFLLTRLGYDVSIPEDQHCCGATHLHNGQKNAALKLKSKNHTSFDALNCKAVLFFSPACGSLLESTDTSLIQDARAFILHELERQGVALKPLLSPVALHESCAQRNISADKNLNIKLLRLIPDINIIQSKQPALCCGAGGLQNINHPTQAASLLKQKMASFDLSQTEIILSDNIGCSLHIRPSLSAYNRQLDVLHPLSLLARQWPQDD